MSTEHLEIFDNPDTIDRYTVLLGPSGLPNEFDCVGMSAAPFHPQGFYQHSTAKRGPHLGKRIKFSDLPADCQKAIQQELKGI